MRTVAVIQARMGSTRLPGKILEPIDGVPLVSWTISSVAAVRDIDELVVATTDTPSDDAFVEWLQRDGRVRVHRGPVHDVLMRVWNGVVPLGPDIVIRQTADNPFADPTLMAAQLARLQSGDFDYVGIAGLPYGIGAEVVRIDALRAAVEEATEWSDREHVLTYIWRQTDRFRIGALDPPPSWRHARYTVDTAADLAFARAIAERWGKGPPVTLADLERIIGTEPDLATINAAIPQRDSSHAQLAAFARHDRAD
jgi:spore coat polysaccharide biosynthesis protein SpsF